MSKRYIHTAAFMNKLIFDKGMNSIQISEWFSTVSAWLSANKCKYKWSDPRVTFYIDHMKSIDLPLHILFANKEDLTAFTLRWL